MKKQIGLTAILILVALLAFGCNSDDKATNDKISNDKISNDNISTKEKVTAASSSQTCKLCHVNITKMWENSAHTGNCEVCHGPGKDHVSNPSKQNIINPLRMDDDERRKMVCEQCHTKAETSDTVLPSIRYITKSEDSRHANMACFDCHIAHKGEPEPNVTEFATPLEKCQSCHGNTATDVIKVFKSHGTPQHIFDKDL